MKQMRPDRWWLPLFAAWLTALTATLSAIFVGEIMGQRPCVLCWYQRIAMFPLPLILGIACFREDPRASWRYGLPLTALGGMLAGFHLLSYYEILPTEIQPCDRDVSCSGPSMTVLGVLPLPLLSFASFAGICLLLLVVRKEAKL